jgi:hypothetical protein
VLFGDVVGGPPGVCVCVLKSTNTYIIHKLVLQQQRGVGGGGGRGLAQSVCGQGPEGGSLGCCEWTRAVRGVVWGAVSEVAAAGLALTRCTQVCFMCS